MTCQRCGHLEGEHLDPLPLPAGATLTELIELWARKPCFKVLDDPFTYCDCEDYLT